MKRLGTIAAAALLAVPALGGSAQASAKTAVYTLSNATTGNQVLEFSRAVDGSLQQTGAYATSGLGTGAGLGSQNAVIVTADRQFLLAVNAGSDSISAFKFGKNGLKLLNTVPSNGTTPISVTAHDNVVYVLNAGSLSISGFFLGAKGLTALPNSTRSLSPGAAGPAQVSFDPTGSALVVSEKTSNAFDVFTVGGQRVVSSATQYPSAGGVPFGFAFDGHGHLLAAQANAGPGESAASAYAVGPGGAFSTIAGPVLTHQAAACWLVTSKDGRYAFTANGGSGSISSFAVAADGTPTLLGSTVVGAGSHPLDEAVAGTTLFVLADAFHALASYRIGQDGSLSPLGGGSGLPAGAMGLAAR
jgi:6-phosphogluconolactonase